MTAAEALRAGLLVVLPTDTVYGLCCAATPAAIDRLYVLKGRDPSQPSALLAASVDDLLAAVPELDRERIRPGAYTSILPNPARRFPWICGTTPDAIGVRVQNLPRVAADVIRELGAVVATSANLHGGADPRSIDELDPVIRAGAAAIVDGGELPGIPSTVIDFTGAEPRVIRR